MKILQLCAVDFTAYHLLRPLGAAMREEGHEVTFCCSPGEGLALLEGAAAFASLIPEIRSNLVMCLERSDGPEDVVGVPGR